MALIGTQLLRLRGWLTKVVPKEQVRSAHGSDHRARLPPNRVGIPAADATVPGDPAYSKHASARGERATRKSTTICTRARIPNICRFDDPVENLVAWPTRASAPQEFVRPGRRRLGRDSESTKENSARTAWAAGNWADRGLLLPSSVRLAGTPLGKMPPNHLNIFTSI